MILIFDIGKTNKKCLVFDEGYRIVFEKNAVLPETADEDGDPCEDLFLLKNWISETFSTVLESGQFDIRAVNCTAYGASFVHLDARGEPLTPLYNYLKPFPVALQRQFFERYGGEQKMALETASPILGNLNSGLQLYWLKYERPGIFQQIKWSLHLPQYIAYLLHREIIHAGGAIHRVAQSHPVNNDAVSEITSIGCHTLLWDFQKNDYHDWVKAEGIVGKLPPLAPIHRVTLSHPVNATKARVPAPIHRVTLSHPVNGAGLHDSSAALIPYLASFREPFVLLSTGTWCISLNPFNDEPLTPGELENDCLCYLTFEGKPVKAARYFGGNEHEKAIQHIAAQYNVPADFYKTADLEVRTPAEAAYLDFMRQLVDKQVLSTRLAIGQSAVRRIFVDGGFSKNSIFMQLLAAAFPEMEVFAAEIAQATALGAALAIHEVWNPKPVPENLISLKKY